MSFHINIDFSRQPKRLIWIISDRLWNAWSGWNFDMAGCNGTLNSACQTYNSTHYGGQWPFGIPCNVSFHLRLISENSWNVWSGSNLRGPFAVCNGASDSVSQTQRAEDYVWQRPFLPPCVGYLSSRLISGGRWNVCSGTNLNGPSTLCDGTFDSVRQT